MKISILSIFLVLFLSLLGNNLQAQEWILIREDSEGKYYINSEKENIKGNPKIWSRHEKNVLSYLDGTKIEKKAFDGIQLYLIEYDCTTSKMLRIWNYILYNSNNEIIEFRETKEQDAEWKSIVPNTLTEFLYKAVCDRFN